MDGRTDGLHFNRIFEECFGSECVFSFSIFPIKGIVSIFKVKREDTAKLKQNIINFRPKKGVAKKNRYVSSELEILTI